MNDHERLNELRQLLHKAQLPPAQHAAFEGEIAAVEAEFLKPPPAIFPRMLYSETGGILGVNNEEQLARALAEGWQPNPPDHERAQLLQQLKVAQAAAEKANAEVAKLKAKLNQTNPGGTL